MHEVICETLVKNSGIRGLGKVIKTLERKNLPAEKDRVLGLLLGSPQYNIHPQTSSEETSDAGSKKGMA